MQFKNTLLPKEYTINCQGNLWNLQEPQIMGILNINDNSFYADSRSLDPEAVVHKARIMVDAGAHVLDLGAQSSKPGSIDLGADVEKERLLPIIAKLRKALPNTLLSVDTYHASVAKACLDEGVHMINDISSGDLDREMLEVVAQYAVPYIGMHMQGNPQNMQNNPTYQNIGLEVLDYFIKKREEVRAAGIVDFIVDPGFGFGKTLIHNYQLLHALDAFQVLDCPVLVGVSRKSMIYKLFNSCAEEALNGTTVIHTLALQKGIHLLRVHDVRQAKETIEIWKYYQAQGS
jgi:dihydropteroate synthase